MYGVIIPNRFADVIAPLTRSIHEKIPCPPRIIIMADNHTNGYGFEMIPYTEPHFCFAQSVNMGIKALGNLDVIIANDDLVLLEWNFFDRLAQLAYADPKVGILSPLIMGCAGNPAQRYHERERYWTPDKDFINVKEPNPVCFPCVYVKREVFNQAGLLNEHHAGYGGDDIEMCRVARAAGWKTAITQRITIQHGDGSEALGEGRGKSWATSFARRWKGGTPPHTEIAEYLNRKERLKKTYPGM